MPEIMRSRSPAFLADLHKPAPVRIFLHIMFCCRLLVVLANDKRFIFSAAAHAQRAVTYLHELQPKPAEIGEAAWRACHPCVARFRLMVHLSQKHEGPAARRGRSCVHRYAKVSDRGWRSFLPPDRAMPARWGRRGSPGCPGCRSIPVSTVFLQRPTVSVLRSVSSWFLSWSLGPKIPSGAHAWVSFIVLGTVAIAVWRACRSVVSPSFGLTRPMRPRFGMSNRRPSSLRLPRSQDRNGRAQLSSPGRCAPIPRETRKPHSGRPLLRGGPAGAVRSPPVNDSHRGRDGRGPRNERGYEHGYHRQLHR